MPTPLPTPVETPATSPAAPVTLTLSAREGTVVELRGQETTGIQFTNGKFELKGGTTAQAKEAQTAFLSGLKQRSGSETQEFKQFVKVLPAQGTPGRVLFTTVLSDPSDPITLRSIRTLAAGGTGKLEYQPDDGSVEEEDVLLDGLNKLLAELHGDLLANFDPASFGILGQPLTPGATFTRLKALKPSNPLASLRGDVIEEQPVTVEQQLRFEGVQGDLLVFSRAARVVQPRQVVSGVANMTTTLREYSLTGDLRVRLDGLPVSATRVERYLADVQGSITIPDSKETVTFALTVGGTSTLNLSAAK